MTKSELSELFAEYFKALSRMTMSNTDIENCREELLWNLFEELDDSLIEEIIKSFEKFTRILKKVC
jgi:hypothetical protein